MCTLLYCVGINVVVAVAIAVICARMLWIMELTNDFERKSAIDWPNVPEISVASKWFVLIAKMMSIPNIVRSLVRSQSQTYYSHHRWIR